MNSILKFWVLVSCIIALSLFENEMLRLQTFVNIMLKFIATIFVFAIPIVFSNLQRIICKSSLCNENHHFFEILNDMWRAKIVVENFVLKNKLYDQEILFEVVRQFYFEINSKGCHVYHHHSSYDSCALMLQHCMPFFCIYKR